MPSAAEPGPDGPPKDPRRVQMNVRVEPSLLDDIDSRRAKVGLSRDEWVRRALRWALRQPSRPTSLRGTTARRTL